MPGDLRPLPHLLSLGGVVLVLAAVDVGTLNLGGVTGRLVAASGALVALLAWWFDRVAGRGGQPLAVLLGAAAGSVSLAATTVVSDSVAQRTPGLVELLCLLLIVRTVCRRLPYRSLVPALALPVLAAGALSARLVDSSSWALFANVDLWFAVLPVAAALWGVQLRTADAARLAETERVRRDERLGLARDLHDDVAHHVTAMIVQAQAGEHVVSGDPEQGRVLFANIERTGQEGLAAMSRMILLLRDGTGADPAPARPSEVVRACVDRFTGAGTGVAAELRLADGVDPDSWPLDLTRSVERLVQEGLTNVRKHARAATSVLVEIEPHGDRLVVRVRDDGGRSGLPRFRQSGFGLLGLSERVRALGGEVTSGPVDGGWQLTASLPRRVAP